MQAHSEKHWKAVRLSIASERLSSTRPEDADGAEMSLFSNAASRTDFEI